MLAVEILLADPERSGTTCWNLAFILLRERMRAADRGTLW